MTSDDANQAAPRAKATLFCPSCGEEGHAIHGWNEWLDSNSGVTHLECPVCEELVQSLGHDTLPIAATADETATGAWSPPAD